MQARGWTQSAGEENEKGATGNKSVASSVMLPSVPKMNWRKPSAWCRDLATQNTNYIITALNMNNLTGQGLWLTRMSPWQQQQTTSSNLPVLTKQNWPLDSLKNWPLGSLTNAIRLRPYHNRPDPPGTLPKTDPHHSQSR